MKNIIKILLAVPTLLIDNALYWGRFWWDNWFLMGTALRIKRGKYIIPGYDEPISPDDTVAMAQDFFAGFPPWQVGRYMDDLERMRWRERRSWSDVSGCPHLYLFVKGEKVVEILGVSADRGAYRRRRWIANHLNRHHRRRAKRRDLRAAVKKFFTETIYECYK